MTVAEKALWEYALRYPLRVRGDQPMKPSLWAFLWSFGFARRLYDLAVVTAAAVKQAQSRRRRLEESEEELERQFQRSLYLQQEAKKKCLELPRRARCLSYAARGSGLARSGSTRSLPSARNSPPGLLPVRFRTRNGVTASLPNLELCRSRFRVTA